MWFNCSVTREGDRKGTEGKEKDPQRAQNDPESSGGGILAFVFISFSIAVIRNRDRSDLRGARVQFKVQFAKGSRNLEAASLVVSTDKKQKTVLLLSSLSPSIGSRIPCLRNGAIHS